MRDPCHLVQHGRLEAIPDVRADAWLYPERQTSTQRHRQAGEDLQAGLVFTSLQLGQRAAADAGGSRQRPLAEPSILPRSAECVGDFPAQLEAAMVGDSLDPGSSMVGLHDGGKR
jgi:hypothetical protein